MEDCKSMQPSSNNPRWAKKFQLVYRSEDHSVRPDAFNTRSDGRVQHIPLIAIDSSAGKDECLVQTAKQWDTIIKRAKTEDKVSDEMKAARFYYFGHVMRDRKPYKPSKAYVFTRILSETETEEEIKKLPVPLRAYAAERRQKIRHRRHPAVTNDSMPQSTLSKAVSNPQDRSTIDPAQINNVNGHLNTQLPHASQVRKLKSGHNLDYLKFAAEEHLNDSELIKGIGRVPINQQIPEPVEPVEDRPWELPPGAWALRDLRFLLQKMISSDLDINNHSILSSITVLPTLDDPEALQLKWNGKTEQTISVFKGREIKSVPFKDVIMIKYNRKDCKILFQFSIENSDKPEELLLVLLPISDTTWQSLQTCCYSLVRGKPSKQRCDMEGTDFFDDKSKALMNLRVKRAPMDPSLNTPVLQVANGDTSVNRKPRRPRRSKFRTRIDHTTSIRAPQVLPARPFDKAQEPSSTSATNPEARQGPPQQPNPTLITNSDQNEQASDPGLVQNSLDMEVEVEADESAPVAEASSIAVERNTPSDAESVVEDAILEGLYYKSILRSGTPVPVLLNDLVVRLRSEKDRETGGRRDKLDIFDGPWRIVEFDIPENTHKIKILTTKNKVEGGESPTHFQFDKSEVKKMLKTKVRLGFPRESHAVHWVELDRLLPITKLEEVRNGKLHASCWGVAELTAFKALQNEMAIRNLTKFNSKHQTPEVEVPEEAPTANSEGAADDADEGANLDVDEDVDEDEVEFPMHIVEVKGGIFVAIMEADPKSIDDGESYLVEKLRSKRLRLLKLNSPEVRKHKLKTDETDPWVKLLLREMPQLAINRIVVSEYKVHWAGWADEDDTWDIGTGNISKGFIDEYHALTDLLRDISTNTRVANLKEMMFKDDLPKVGRGKLLGRRGQSMGSLGTARRQSRQALAGSSKKNSRSAQVSQKEVDEEVLDDDEDIAIAKAVQASLDDAEAEETRAQLKALQKAMGVETEESGTTATPNLDADNEEDGFMEFDDQDGNEGSDVIMAEGSDIEAADSCLEGDNDADEV